MPLLSMESSNLSSCSFYFIVIINYFFISIPAHVHFDCVVSAPLAPTP